MEINAVHVPDLSFQPVRCTERMGERRNPLVSLVAASQGLNTNSAVMFVAEQHVIHLKSFLTRRHIDSCQVYQLLAAGSCVVSEESTEKWDM